MYFLYSLLSAIALLIAAPWLLWRALTQGKYRHAWRERLGVLPSSVAGGMSPTLWLHAVSVGEVLSAVPLVRAFAAAHPDWRIVISTTTRTGRAMAESRFGGVAGVFYFPLDFAWIVRRVLAHVHPTLLVIVETEIWPNVLRLCRAAGVPTVLVNARISDRSFPRYRSVRRWLGPVLGTLDRLCAQSDDTADRLRAIGAPPDRVVVTGSMKFDVAAPDVSAVRIVVDALGGCPVLLAASTLAGEDEVMLDALRDLQAASGDAERPVLVLAPRHPERFDDVAALVERSGLRLLRRTSMAALAGGPVPTFDVLLLDTIGELAALCTVATVVFVGGSLVPAGGHNILEPAAAGKPIVVGPSMSNFAAIARVFLDAGALVQVDDARSARAALVALWKDASRRAVLGDAARGVMAQHGGAVARTMAEIDAVLRARGVTA